MPGTALAESLLRITTQPISHGALRLSVAGDVDLATAPQLRTTVLSSIRATDRPDGIELDLADTTFLDAVGLQVLLDSQRAAFESRMWFTIANPRGAVAQVLTLAGVTDILQVRAARPA